MADNTGPLGQDDIDALLKQAQGDSPPVAAAPPPAALKSTATSAKAGAGGESVALAQGDIDFLLNQAEQALASINSPADSPAPGVKPFRLPEFASTSATSDAATLDLIRDVELDLRIELGRTHMHLEEVLKLAKGSVVTLDKLAGDPVDIFVNGRLIARGEVLILNENFCVRVAELMVPENAQGFSLTVRTPQKGGTRMCCRGRWIVAGLIAAALIGGAPVRLAAQEFPQRQPTAPGSQRDSNPAGQLNPSGQTNTPGQANAAAQPSSPSSTYNVNQATFVSGEKRTAAEQNRSASGSPISGSAGSITAPGSSSKPILLPPAPQDALSEHGSGPRTLGAIVSVVGSLAAVLGLFFGLAWLMRRGLPNAARRLPSEAVDVLGRAPLAGRQQMHLLRFGNKLLLVCVSPSGVDTLGEITDPLEIDRLAGICQQTEPTSVSNTFRNVISQLSGDKSVASAPTGSFARNSTQPRRTFAPTSKTGATTGGEAADV